jgi:hypothetical protein
MFHFTTYFDRNYLSRGLVLYESLKANCKQFELYILCLDEYTGNYFKDNAYTFPEIRVIQIEDLESDDEELRVCKDNRSQIEYYFTLSPCLPLYILKKYNVPHICSLDADIMFFHNVEPIFKLLDQYSIIITPHKFSAILLKEQRQKYGTYNVSFQVFKNNKAGLTCLEKWRRDCIDWCYDYFEDVNGGRFADQKYLDSWKKDQPEDVVSLDMPSAGLAVWNIDNYRYRLKNDIVFVDKEPLIFFHFHNFKILADNLALNGFNQYKVTRSSKILDRNIYLAYWNELTKFNEVLRQQTDFSVRSSSKANKWTQVFNSGTAYFRIKGRSINVNVVRLRDSINLVKRVYGLFSRS